MQVSEIGFYNNGYYTPSKFMSAKCTSECELRNFSSIIWLKWKGGERERYSDKASYLVAMKFRGVVLPSIRMMCGKSVLVIKES